LFLRNRLLAFANSSSDRYLSRVEEQGDPQRDRRTLGRDRSHRALQEQVRLESTADRAGDVRTRSCQGICKQPLPGPCSRQLCRAAKR